MRRFMFILLCSASSTAVARDAWVNPETMGANALAGPAAEAPWTAADSQVTIGAAAQLGRRYDASFTPTFRLALPFGKFVTALFDGMPLEAWWSSPQTKAEWALSESSGVTKADIRFGAKLMFFDGSARGLPALAVRLLTKTTSGKSYDARRFTDAPGYVLDAAVGQRWQIANLWLISLYANAGFFIWQQGADAQNDALQGAVAVSFNWLNHGRLEFETRGYAGWQHDDKVAVTAIRLFADLSPWCSIGATMNVGFLSAPRLEGRLDLSFRFPALLPWVLQ